MENTLVVGDTKTVIHGHHLIIIILENLWLLLYSATHVTHDKMKYYTENVCRLWYLLCHDCDTCYITIMIPAIPRLWYLLYHHCDTCYTTIMIPAIPRLWYLLCHDCDTCYTTIVIPAIPRLWFYFNHLSFCSFAFVNWWIVAGLVLVGAGPNDVFCKTYNVLLYGA